MHFGPTLKLLRVNAGMSLRALARSVGVSSAYLSRVENGHDPAPTPDRLTAIARALELPPSTLYELARQTGPALARYIERTPAAGAFFLEVARRNLDVDQLARLREVMDHEFPPVEDRPATAPLSALIGRRILLDFDGSGIEAVIDVGTARCAEACGVAAEDLYRRIRQREAEAPTALGHGVAVPHAVVPGARSTAALVTLSRSLFHDSPDGEPIEVAIILISGVAGREYLVTLAQVARLASHGLARELRDAATPAAALSVIQQLERRHARPCQQCT